MRIRLATVGDAAAVAPLMWQAMPEVVRFWVGSADKAAALAFLTHWIAKKNNLYSFENTMVCMREDAMLACVTGYDGARLQALRAPLLAAQAARLQRELVLEDETEAGEWYVDSLSVDASARRQGLGRKMLEAFAQYAAAQGGTRLGLLVDVNKKDAARLYARIGFVAQGQKMLTGGVYQHMVLPLV